MTAVFFILAFFWPLLQVIKVWLLGKFHQASQGKFDGAAKLVMFFFFFLDTAIAYSVLLLVLTYNGYILFWVAFSLGIGYLFFNLNNDWNRAQRRRISGIEQPVRHSSQEVLENVKPRNAFSPSPAPYLVSPNPNAEPLSKSIE